MEKAVEFPTLRDHIDFEQAKGLLEDHGAVSVISGWIPATREKELMDVVTSAGATELFERVKSPGWGVLIRDAEPGETPPTLIEPPKLFRPVTALFAGLGIAPGYTEGDVSVPFMCYFSLFFAMLVGDGAYGAIFLVATLAMRKRLPDAWFVLLTVFSSATVLWGASLQHVVRRGHSLVRGLADGEVARRPELPQHDAPVLHDRRVAPDAREDMERRVPLPRHYVPRGVRLGGSPALHVFRDEFHSRHILRPVCREAWQAVVHRVAKSWTRLSD